MEGGGEGGREERRREGGEEEGGRGTEEESRVCVMGERVGGTCLCTCLVGQSSILCSMSVAIWLQAATKMHSVVKPYVLSIHAIPY